MKKIIAACGNDCSICPRYVEPPFEKTEEELRHTAELWLKIGYRDHLVSNEEISCHGCKPENWCRYKVIACTNEKEIENCGQCRQYPCDDIKECFKVTASFAPECKKVCSTEEYNRMSKAFFEKEKNLCEKKTLFHIMEAIKDFFANDSSGHDYYHSIRVLNMATELAEYENVDLFIVQLAALLHDVDDLKLSPETYEKKENAVTFMRKELVDEEVIKTVCAIIDEISYKGSDSVIPKSMEGRCVQDADRLDAIGAIGIARAFAYGGSHNRSMYDPDIRPLSNIDKDQYQRNNTTTINHFYEKLFHLKEMMNTEKAREYAERRECVMQEFVTEFLAEWDGKL